MVRNVVDEHALGAQIRPGMSSRVRRCKFTEGQCLSQCPRGRGNKARPVCQIGDQSCKFERLALAVTPDYLVSKFSGRYIALLGARSFPFNINTFGRSLLKIKVLVSMYLCLTRRQYFNIHETIRLQQPRQ